MTVESDWGDWLPRAVEDADPDGLAIWYLGCNGFIVKSSGGTTVYIDPYLGIRGPAADAADDSRSVQPRRRLGGRRRAGDARTHRPRPRAHARTDSRTHGRRRTTRRTRGWPSSRGGLDRRVGRRRRPVHRNRRGDTLEIGDLTVHVEPANDPDAEHPISYVFEHGETTFFHGGDARPGNSNRSARTTTSTSVCWPSVQSVTSTTRRRANRSGPSGTAART